MKMRLVLMTKMAADDDHVQYNIRLVLLNGSLV